MVLIVIYLTLTPRPPEIGIDFKFIDKIEHLLAYLLMSGWFAQIYHSPRARLTVIVLFSIMGILLEILQWFGGVRFLEAADMAANASGAILGVLLSRLSLLSDLLLRFDAYIYRLTPRSPSTR